MSATSNSDTSAREPFQEVGNLRQVETECSQQTQSDLHESSGDRAERQQQEEDQTVLDMSNYRYIAKMSESIGCPNVLKKLQDAGVVDLNLFIDENNNSVGFDELMEMVEGVGLTPLEQVGVVTYVLENGYT